MKPLEAVEALVRAVPHGVFVSSLGTATSALRAATEDAPHLYLGGAMGSALAVALGVADRRPERTVVAVLGDGETLMGAGSLWSLAGLRPANLVVAVLADGAYSITGGQPIAVPTAFAAVAGSLGLDAAVVRDESALVAALASRPRAALLELACGPGPWPGPSPFVDPPVVRWRFEQALTDGL